MQTLLRALVWLPLVLLATACHDDNDNVAVVEPLATGLYTLESGGIEREYYLQLPSDYQPAGGVQAAALGDPKPLVFTFHGYTGQYTNWVGENRFYDFVDVVGDGAIIVSPNGVADVNGDRSWGGSRDLDFFADMLGEFDLRGLNYDPARIFVVGHSNGAGFANELGCAYGDVIRGVVAAAGGLISTDCNGAAAVMLMHGSNDPLTNGLIAGGTRDYWVKYNGWDLAASQASPLGPCIDYSFADKPANEPYPVLWCLHTQGHSWPDFGSVTAWAFMNSLAEVEPGPEAPPGGGTAVAKPPSDSHLFVQLEMPAGAPRPLRAAFSLRPLSFIDNPTCSAPDIILNYPFPLDGILKPGEVSDQLEVPVTYFPVPPAVPSEWALSVTVIVEGGTPTFIPTPGVDYDVLTPVTISNASDDIIVSDVLTPVADLCGFGN